MTATLMLLRLSDDLTDTVEQAAAGLRRLDDAAAAAKPAAAVWSIKEIIGHLVDSAAHNQQRFVRAQQDRELALPGYDQNHWVRSQDHQSRPWPELLEFWVLYNRHLAHTIRRIPDAILDVPCRIGGNEPVTLLFVVEDYLRHLRHHLNQIHGRT